ncbi:MAG: Rpn family recombination-promoting nuclease/putative transposase [Endomicrobium sp.]|jgi:predicted transposase/invertase (TIGR01784 family)|nr:Rpn family recombination-promoting nuclease/putative transposase [Endomicrobium sp.]
MNDEKIFLPTNDLLFKKMLDNTEVAIGFINTLFGTSVKEVEHLTPYDLVQLRSMYANKKLSRTEVDFICGSDTEEKFIVELQVRREEIFDLRALYYLCVKFCNGYAEKGAKYAGLKPVRMMCLLGFQLFKNKDKRFHNYSLIEREDKSYLFNMPTFELSFFEYRKKNKLNDNLEYVSKFLKSGIVENNYPDFLKKAADIVLITNRNAREREAMQMYDDLDVKIEEVAKYRERKGIKEGAKRVAELVSKGYTVDQAVELVSSTVDRTVDIED